MGKKGSAVLAKKILRGWRTAAPSFVMPGTVGENCRFLAGKADEVGIVFFQTRASLDYGPDDLPPDMAGLGLDYHVHLPLDLPWDKGPDEVARLVRLLARKVEFLGPRNYVLHPPGGAQGPEFLQRFVNRSARFGLGPDKLVLENVEECGLVEIWPLIMESGCKVCLDLGHMLAYSQTEILALPGLWERVEMFHIYSPGKPGPKPGHVHASLAGLDREGRALLREMAFKAAPGGTIMFEIFDWPGVSESIELFRTWAGEWEKE